MNTYPYHVNIHLSFSQGITYEPVVCRLAQLFDLEFNITRAQISTRREGFLVLDLLGTKENCDKGIEYLRERGVNVSFVTQRISYDEDVCIDCGACTALCPTAALFIDEKQHLNFDKTKCIVCEKCLYICPVHALTACKEDGAID